MKRCGFHVYGLALVWAAGTAHGQVVNGTFETGSFSGWSQFGDTGFTSVQSATVHSGSFAGEFGPSGSPGGIQQTLTANAGQQMLLEFWYQAQGDQNAFAVTVGGQVIYSVTNDITHTAWTHYSFGFTAPVANPVLQFSFFNPPSYDYLDDVTVIVGALGACCLSDGTCIVQSAGGCSAVGGTYRGDGIECGNANCPQPSPGACCRVDGTCAFLSQVACGQIANSVWRGENVTCAAANCQPSGYIEQGDAGSLPATAAVVSGPAGASLSLIQGNMAGASDADMYKIQVCNHAAFAASLVGRANFDSQIWLFDGSGKGVTCDDDAGNATMQSAIGHQFVTVDGAYFLAVTAYNRDPRDSSFQLLWQNSPFTLEHAPDGPGALNPIASWDNGTTDAGGAYQIGLTGACFIPNTPACYANCDASTAAPILNASDFQCFLNKFAAADSYANCDNSTSPPVLNANDFQCFLNAYAAGCT